MSRTEFGASGPAARCSPQLFVFHRPMRLCPASISDQQLSNLLPHSSIAFKPGSSTWEGSLSVYRMIVLDEPKFPVQDPEPGFGKTVSSFKPTDWALAPGLGLAMWPIGFFGGVKNKVPHSSAAVAAYLGVTAGFMLRVPEQLRAPHRLKAP